MQLGEKATITATPDYAYGKGGFPAWCGTTKIEGTSYTPSPAHAAAPLAFSFQGDYARFHAALRDRGAQHQVE